MSINIENIHITKPPILAHSIVEELESAIIYGDIPGGAHLTEEAVCQLTGLSRSPVREALNLLEKDGLVERVPRRGFRVSKLSVEELDALYICRISLEMVAAELATKNGSDADLEAIQQAHLDCVRMFEKGDIRGHFKANVGMSQRIFAAAHNRPLSRLLDMIHKQALRYRYAAYEKSKAIRIRSIENNALFVDFIMCRDAQRAAAQARKSIESSHAVIRNCLLPETGAKTTTDETALDIVSN